MMEKTLTNIEMLDIMHDEKRRQRECIARGECCGRIPMSDGVCFGVGRCPEPTRNPHYREPIGKKTEVEG